jgi:hypothetical protein
MGRWQAQLVLQRRTALENPCAAEGQDSDFPREIRPAPPVKKTAANQRGDGAPARAATGFAFFFVLRRPDRLHAST